MCEQPYEDWKEQAERRLQGSILDVFRWAKFTIAAVALALTWILVLLIVYALS